MKYLFLIILFAFPLVTSAEDAFICIADSATGFTMDENTKKWKPTTFDVSENKIVITRGEKHPWVVKNMGEKSIRIRCENEFSGPVLNCQLGLSNLRFDKDKLRYLISYELGYWSYDDEDEFFEEGKNTPYMEIGKCTGF